MTDRINNRHYAIFFSRLLCLMAAMIIFSLPGCREKPEAMKRIWYSGSYNRDFNDLNSLHMQAAMQLGINRPVASRQEAEKIAGKMTRISTNRYYEVEELTHSVPYLVPEAAMLLQDIGRNFCDTLQQLNAPLYKIKVTSVTRTVGDIRHLRKNNTNSSLNSAHRYGTTIDISWVRYARVDKKDKAVLRPDQLKMVLATVLRDLKKAGRCYVKHERRQGCFHITARK